MTGRLRTAAEVLPFLGLALLLAAIGALFLGAPPFAPDSWAYYELSRSLWTDGYRLGHLRHFAGADLAAPSNAFPPAWPFLWSLGSRATGSGVGAGPALNLLLAFGFAALAEAVGRRLAGLRWVGLASALFVLALPGMLQEVVGAGSIPLTLTLAAAALLLALGRTGWSPAAGAALGLLAGAMVMARFDMPPFVLVLGAGLAALSRSAPAVLAYAAAVLLVLAPWMALSLAHHGSIFSTPQAASALAADPAAFITDWHPPGAGPPTLFERPLDWLGKVLGNLAALPGTLWESLGGRVTKGLVLALPLAGLLLARDLRRGAAALRRDGKALRRTATVALFLVAALASLAPQLVTGFLDHRYFSLAWWLVALAALAALGGAARARLGPGRVEAAALGLCLAIALGAVLRLALLAAPQAAPALPTPMAAEQLRGCVGGDPGLVLFLHDTTAARFSALHGIAGAMTPRNFMLDPPDEGTAALFFRSFGINFVAGEPAAVAAIFPPGLLDPVPEECGVPLWRVAVHP